MGQRRAKCSCAEVLRRIEAKLDVLIEALASDDEGQDDDGQEREESTLDGESAGAERIPEDTAL
jgi:hypothetical protein